MKHQLFFQILEKKDNGEEYIKVSFERPTEKGFDTVVFELPSYEIIEQDGNYSEEEIKEFKATVEKCAHLFFKYAREEKTQSSEIFVKNKYKIITLCGSIKFKNEFMKVQEKLTLDGNIVLTPNFFNNIKKEDIGEKTKKMLDEMHKQKIDMSDKIYVINVGGYIGESTKNEIEYAKARGKKVLYMENKKTEQKFIQKGKIKMKMPHEIIVDEKIKLIKIEKDFNQKELIENLEDINDKLIQDFLGMDKNINKEIEEIKEKILKKKNIYYSIYRKSEFIGWFYLYDINEKYKRANLSLGIKKDLREHILSFNMIDKVVKTLFDVGFNRLGLEIEDTNITMLKLAKHLEKIGFKYEGKLRDNYGIDINSNVWSLLKREYSNF